MEENNISGNGTPSNENATQQNQSNFFYHSPTRNVIPVHLQGASMGNMVSYVPMSSLPPSGSMYGNNYMWHTSPNASQPSSFINQSQQSQEEERKKRPKHDERDQGRNLLQQSEEDSEGNGESKRGDGNGQSGLKVLFSSPPVTTNAISSIPESSGPSWLPSSSSADPFNKLFSSSSQQQQTIPSMGMWPFPPPTMYTNNLYDEYQYRNRNMGNSLYPSNPSFPWKSNNQLPQTLLDNGDGRGAISSASYPSPFPEGFLTMNRPVSMSSSNVGVGGSGGRFVLKDQPNAFQRKSYKSERRYLTPNPLIICTRESCGEISSTSLPKIVEGSVRVELVDGLGRKLDPNKKIFEPSDGQFEQPLNLKSSAEFSLKVLQNSGPDLFCLLFTVSYVTNNGERFIEQIQSRKFVVQSNKALKAREKPSVVGIKPERGNNTQEVDVWIKGSEFHRQGILVCFGDRMGKVVEINENLLVVTVPVRAELKERMDVQVTVSNKYRNEVKTADKKLTYSYLPTVVTTT
eukprot:TRINITY_DN2542_c0_g1_i1.p1 TRINITY_DN2542_c0_g1~~TRINITY_DN2542_c0_g1_i1.p1  ORF type:complete len:517 (-),score=153.82 TRINITY_DN2542_c0_g1_i1:39-1589(-)